MFRLAILIWVVGATTLAGIFVTVVLLVPSMQAQAMKNIPIAAAIGAAVAIPISLWAAKAIAARTKEA